MTRRTRVVRVLGDRRTYYPAPAAGLPVTGLAKHLIWLDAKLAAGEPASLSIEAAPK